MLGKKKAAHKTVLILDIESGSVAGALLHFSSNAEPRLFAYKRVHLPVTMQPAVLQSHSLEHALTQVLHHASTVASRMRTHAPHTKAGEVVEVSAFLAAPWGTPNFLENKSSFLPGIREFITQEVKALFGDAKISFHTSADSIAYGALQMGRAESVLASLRGELVELLHIDESVPVSYGTTPGGVHALLRTLKVHDRMSEHEARSALLLLNHHHDRAYEPLTAAGRELSSTFADTVKVLLERAPARHVLVLGDGELSGWFAKTIADEPKLAGLFADDSTVEPVYPHLGLANRFNTPIRDPFVLLAALFVDGRRFIK
jgi:hypothetical protein